MGGIEMSEWKKVKLGEITESCLGKMLDAAKNRGEYKPYLANLNVRWGSFDTENLSLMKFEDDEDDRYGIKYGDLIICEGGEPGRCAIWKEQIPDMKIQKALHRVRPKTELVDNFYLFYWFLLAGKRNWIDQYCTGATIKHLPGQKLKEILVDIPSLDTQHRIATILSRYDSLIENYQKQIKLLEEAAQRLYKEWFVELRFPGYESTKIVNGVPEGWEKKTIGDIVVYFDKQRKPLSSMQRMNMEKIYPYYGAAALMDYVDSYLFDGIYLLFGEDGTVITPDNFPVLQYVWGKFWVNNHAHVLRGKDSISTEFLYSMFKEMPIADVVTGAAQPKISQGRLSDKKILMPSLKLIQEWSCIAKHYFGRIRVITEQIRLLTEARDRLLPKLMGGEMDVVLENYPAV
ncbi:MAG: restriction endonuclease subunit S [Bacteroidales bacterium]|nr:restriction endonuclease subunit S [Bacteroidales bacterium]